MKKYELLATPFHAIVENIDKAPGSKYSNLEQVIVKHEPYESVTRVISQNLEKMLKDVRMNVESGNLKNEDLDFIENDVLGRAQDAIMYAISSVKALRDNENTT